MLVEQRKKAKGNRTHYSKQSPKRRQGWYHWVRKRPHRARMQRRVKEKRGRDRRTEDDGSDGAQRLNQGQLEIGETGKEITVDSFGNNRSNFSVEGVISSSRRKEKEARS